MNETPVMVKKTSGEYLVGFDGDNPVWLINKWRAGVFKHSEISQSFSRNDKRKLEVIEVAR